MVIEYEPGGWHNCHRQSRPLLEKISHWGLILPGPEEEPEREDDEEHASDCHQKTRAIHVFQWPPNLKLRRRRAFVTTLTEESAMAAEAMTGFSVQPVKG